MHNAGVVWVGHLLTDTRLVHCIHHVAVIAARLGPFPLMWCCLGNPEGSFFQGSNLAVVPRHTIIQEGRLRSERRATQDTTARGLQPRPSSKTNSNAPELYIKKKDAHTGEEEASGEDRVGKCGNDEITMAKLTQWAILRGGCSVPHVPHFRERSRHVHHGEVQLSILVGQNDKARRTRSSRDIGNRLRLELQIPTWVGEAHP